MNSLSWMIYAAEVFGRLSDACGFIAFMSAIGAVVGIPMTIMAENDDALAPELGRKIRRIWIIPVVTGVIAIVAPSQQTLYLIAASEAGETIITNPEAREVFNDLKTIIKGKMKEQLPK